MAAKIGFVVGTVADMTVDTAVVLAEVVGWVAVEPEVAFAVSAVELAAALVAGTEHRNRYTAVTESAAVEVESSFVAVALVALDFESEARVPAETDIVRSAAEPAAEPAVATPRESLGLMPGLDQGYPLMVGTVAVTAVVVVLVRVVH